MKISNRVNHQKSELYFLLILLTGIFILIFFIFKPFLYALILTMVFATVFGPLHRKTLTMTRDKKSLAVLLATISGFNYYRLQAIDREGATLKRGLSVANGKLITTFASLFSFSLSA